MKTILLSTRGSSHHQICIMRFCRLIGRHHQILFQIRPTGYISMHFLTERREKRDGCNLINPPIPSIPVRMQPP